MQYMHTDCLCSLRLVPRQHEVGITFNCGGQCSFVTSSSNHLCGELIDELEIECNQAECSTRVYNLSACANVENGIIVTGPGNIMPNQIPTIDGNTNDMTMEQSQAATTTSVTVHSTTTETTSRIETQDVSCATKPLSSREVQAVIGALVGLVVVLLVMATIPWIWICWRSKVNKGPKGDKQQIRCIYYIGTSPCLCYSVYTHNLAAVNHAYC
jgi:hypothetical protein